MTTPRFILRLFALSAAVSVATAAAAAPRAALETAVLSLARKDFVRGEDRPKGDGRVDTASIVGELALLSRHIPRWDEAMKLHAEDPNHPHTVGEHELRTLYYFAHGAYARSIQAEPRRFYLGCLTALLHDMGKLDSPRDGLGRQKKDRGHPALCAAYVRKYFATLGLSVTEAEWMARILAHHTELGALQRADREPGWMPAGRLAAFRGELARALRTRANVEYLAALTEADVLGINGWSYGKWELKDRLPRVTERLAHEAEALQGK